MRYVRVYIAFAIAALAGCGNGASGITPGRVITETPAHLRSWMSPSAAKTPNLLYVANGNGTITVYDYKNGSNLTLVGTLIGFSQPGGMCADKSGNVYITDYAVRQIVIYAHGASTPTTVIQQKVGFPYACAIDPTTGNLAVTDEHPNAHYESHATVDIYAPGEDKGQGGIYGGHNTFSQAYFDAYDGAGNLFVDGTPCQRSYCYYGGGPPALFEMPKGSTKFVELTIKGAKLKNPTGLDWVSPSLLLTEALAKKTPVGYKILISGSDATVVAALPYPGTEKPFGVGQRAKDIIVPDSATNTVRLYSLSNGSLIGSLTDGVNKPFSVVVSQK
jgi:hypothetical protein